MYLDQTEVKFGLYSYW